MASSILSERISGLRKSPVARVIRRRLGEFRAFRDASDEALFSELCFCILTANFSAQRGIAIHKKLGNAILTDDAEQLERKLRSSGYRFPKTRAEYIVTSRTRMHGLTSALEGHHGNDRRLWLVKHIKGLGMKEASHFLRNVGYEDYAIIDFHIIDILAASRIIRRPKSLTPKRYLAIERTLRKIAEGRGMSLAELDLYLWFLETDTVLK